MNLKPNEIFEEYKKGCEFKSAIGTRGLFEQNRINERFFIGDQWHGASCGSERPLVRHNVIKRIGDYKMSQILNKNTNMSFSAEGIPTKEEKTDIESYSGALSDGEVGAVMSALKDYYSVTAERVGLEALSQNALRDAYISGTALLYTYWNPALSTGTFADSKKSTPIKGDISCEILKIEDAVFGDPYCENIQNQPYIIISTRKAVGEVLREARLNGADISALQRIEEEAVCGKINLLTKLYKEYSGNGNFKIMGIKVTENAVVRPEFSTELSLYPIAKLNWESKNNCAYGESEITHLIPNQIAINRMITANVWASLTSGLPIMLVNGDTVTDKITNDPGQIIKIYGSNEDVAGAVKFVAPETSIKEFDESINTLINNTLTQSGANEVALGDSRADNATALMTMRNAALMPLQLVKGRYYTFLEDVARIWAEFWVSYYGKRMLKICRNGVYSYIPFDGKRYRELIINTKIDVNNSPVFSDKEQLETLLTLYDKGILSKAELLERLPTGLIPDVKGITPKEATENDGI